MLLRPGGLPRERDRARARRSRSTTCRRLVDPEAPLAPGMLASHYAPRAQLRLRRVDRVNPGEALLAFGARLPPGTGSRDRAQSVAGRRSRRGRGQSVFASAHARPGRCATIAVMPVPHEGLGEAINDRLARAARRDRSENESRRHERNEQTRRPPCLAATLARLIAVVGEKNAITDKDKQAPYLVEIRDAVDRPHAGGAAAGLDRRRCRRCSSSPTRPDRDRAAGRQHRPGRRTDPAQRRDRAVAQPHGQDPRGRSGLQHHHRARPASRLQRAREAAADADRLYPQLLPSEGTCTIGGNLSTNAGGTAALAHGIARSHALGLEVVLADGRVLQQSQQAEEGQHRLRPARTCSSARKARSASSPRRCCGWCRGRARSRPRGPASRRSQAAVDLLGLAHRAHRRRRHELRDHGARGHRHRAEAFDAARAIRWRPSHP